MMRTSQKIGSIIMLCLFFSSLISYPVSASKELTMIDNPSQITGNTLYVGGSGPNNYSQIQDAVDNASEGDIVFVYSGFYQENILISLPIQLIGIENTSTIIDGGLTDTVVTIRADDTVLVGFTIQNAKNDIQHAGIEISAATNVQILANIIQDNGMLGISLLGPDTQGTKILMNTIRNNSYGLCLFDSPKTLISMNNIYDNGEGVYVIGSTSSTLINNTVRNRGLGIHLENSYDIIVDGNWIVNNANGIYAFNSSKITLAGNCIVWNRWYGLWTKGASDNTIYGNTISNNIDVGLFLESSFDTTVSNNTLWDNDNGIYLKDSAGNLIQNNNLRNNKVNGCFVAHTLIHRRNIWKMNYWERARLLPYPILGYIKLEKLTISSINVDWIPLRHPPQSSMIQRFANDETILYVGGNGPNNYSSIQAAITDAHQNDTIYVFNGTYYEAVRIDKPLRLLGENKTTTILEGNGTRDILTIIADYVTISSFTIQNGHFNILINHSSFADISGNNIGSGLHGVSVQDGCRAITISKNSFLENVYGIRIFSSTDVTISYNNLYSFKINAFYFGTTLAHGLHHWYKNYWEGPRYLPYLIHGKIRVNNFSLIWFNVDWFPSRSPY